MTTTAMSLENSFSKTLIYNAASLAWVAATGSVTGEGNVTVVNFPASYPVTNINLDAKLSDIKAKTDNIDVLLSTRLKGADTLTKVSTVDTITNNVKTNIVQDVATVSTVNSTTNINAGITWSGTFEAITNQTAIQFIANYNQNTIIYVEQSMAGGTPGVADLTDIYYGYANVGIAKSIASVAPYYRIRVANQNAAAQATGSIISAMTAILNILPRTTDYNDNFRIASPMDTYGFVAENTPQGEMRMITPFRVVGSQFDLNGNAAAVDTNFWTPVVDATAQPGTVVQANGSVALNSGTNIAAFSKLYSTRRARYVGGHSNRFRANIRLGDTGTANNTRRWGVVYGTTMPTITDGAWFQLSGTTFSIVTKRANAADSVVSSGSFNGQLGSVYSPTLNNTIYEIYWTNNKVYFVIGDSILHTIAASLATWAATLSFSVNRYYGEI